MKKLSFIILLLLPLITFGQAEKVYRSIIVDSIKARAQDTIDIKDFAQFDSSISVGGNVEASAIANFESAIKGLLAPRVTTTQRDNIPSPAEGLLVYNVTTDAFNVFDVTWKAVGGTAIDFGTGGQVPSMNVTEDNFAYSADFSLLSGNLRVGGSATSVNGAVELKTSANSTEIRLRVASTSFLNGSGGLSVGHTGAPASGNEFDVVGNFIMSKATSSPPITQAVVSDIFTIRSRFNFTGAVDNFDATFQVIPNTPASSPQTGRLAVTIDGNEALNIDETQKTTLLGSDATSSNFSFLATDNVSTELFKIRNDGHAISDGEFSTTKKDITLGAAVTTFVTTSNVIELTGDGGANTVATITGAVSGQYLLIIFVDDKVTITDDNGHGANTIDLSAAFSSLDDTTIHLIYDGVSWYEISRSVN